MARIMAIWILCPQHVKRVRGTYEADEAGQFPVGPDGEFLLAHARCGHDGGRCMETLCALHRYNARGPATWYPGGILAARPRTGAGRGLRGRDREENADDLA